MKLQLQLIQRQLLNINVVDEQNISIEPVRLQKLLANAGLASRREIEKLIVDGRIQINGELAVLGAKATLSDDVTVDGQSVSLGSELKTYLLHKPKGVISTASDDQGRKTVVDLIDSELRLFPVGRLDAETTGLILVTNDGDLTYKLTHPKFGVDKKYVARLKGHVHESNIDILKNGVELEDGVTAPAKVRVLARKTDESLIEITIHEGRNRQIRRMADSIGHPVISLQRTAIGPISDSKLAAGKFRELSIAEIHALKKATSGENVSQNEGRVN